MVTQRRLHRAEARHHVVKRHQTQEDLAVLRLPRKNLLNDEAEDHMFRKELGGPIGMPEIILRIHMTGPILTSVASSDCFGLSAPVRSDWR